MVMVLPSYSELSSLEHELATHPRFGNPVPIREVLDSLYMFTLDVLADQVPAVTPLFEALSHISEYERTPLLGSPALRSILNDSIASLKKGHLMVSEEGLAIFNQALAIATSENTRKALETTVPIRLPLPSDDYPTWLWQDDGLNNPASKRFRELYFQELVVGSGAKDLVLRTPDEDMQMTLGQGARLLSKLVPTLSQSLFAHVSIVAIVDVADRSKWVGSERPGLFESGSKNSVPAALFLSPNALRSPWSAAEALFHEACHQKLFDLVAVRSIHCERYSAPDSVRVKAIWNRSLPENPNDWTADRALVAFHVYTYLSLFSLIAASKRQELIELREVPMNIDPLSAGRRALDRARYLGNALRNTATREFGDDGLQLLSWLMDILNNALDPNPPEGDLTTRLVSGLR